MSPLVAVPLGLVLAGVSSSIVLAVLIVVAYVREQRATGDGLATAQSLPAGYLTVDEWLWEGELDRPYDYAEDGL